MVLTPSSMVPLGTKAPNFTLLDVISGKEYCLSALKKCPATVICFICNHCPYVKHLQSVLVSLARGYQQKGAAFVAINSNDIKEYPEDGPDEMKRIAQECDYPFPYLFDESQLVARAYGATCTPDFFIFDEKMQLAYRGQFDDSRPGNHQPVTGKDLSEALDCLLNGEPISPDQVPSIGCNIKWKKRAPELNLVK